MSPGDTFQIEPERSSSSGSKLLLGIGIGCGVMALLCCGVFGGGGFFLYRFITNAISEEPADVRAETAAIATIEIPARLEPRARIVLDPPFVDKIGSFVVYENDDETLFLADFQNLETEGKTPEEVVRDFNINVNNQTVGGGSADVDVQTNVEDFEETSRESRERPLRGGTAKFDIIYGVNTKSDEKRIVVYGIFPGRVGGGVLMLHVAATDESEAEIDRMIESLE